MSDTDALQIYANECKQGEEEECLVFRQEAQPIALSKSLFFRKANSWNADIGIHIDFVRMAMMRIMFIVPPGIAHTDQQIGHKKDEYIVFPGFIENLSMTTIVAEKTNLPKDKGEKRGIQQLQPEVIYQQQEGY